MTKREFALLLVRLMGLYVIATSFSYLAFLSYAFMGSSPATLTIGRLLLALMPFVLQVCFGIFLWLFTAALTSALTNGLSENEPISQWKPREIAQIGFAVTGISSLLQGAQLTGQSIGQIELIWSGNSPTFAGWIMVLSGIPSSFIGLVLIFGARFFSYWFTPRGEFVPPSGKTAPDAAD